MALHIGLDVGTQGTKCLIFDEARNEVVARASQSYSISVQARPGQAEQHPQLWVDACRETLMSALDQVDPARVRSIAVAGQQHGLVALDAGGQVLRPAKLWCDVESASEAQELSAAYGEALVPSFTGECFAYWRGLQHTYLGFYPSTGIPTPHPPPPLPPPP